MPIHRDIGKTHLLLPFSPNVNDTVFQISNTTEEVHQEIIRHAVHCIKVGYSFIEIQSIDIDVLILLFAYIAMELASNNDSFDLYFKLVRPNPTLYNILSLMHHLAIDGCKVLPYFFAFTEYDTMPSFNGKGKYTFCDTWIKSKKKNHSTKTFIKLGNMPEIDKFRQQEYTGISGKNSLLWKCKRQ